MKYEKTKIIVGVCIFAIILLAVFFVPIDGKGSTLLRVCKFNEATGTYNACFFRWQSNEGPSFYF